MSIESMIMALSIMTLLSHVFIVFSFIYLAFKKNMKTIGNFFSEYAVIFSLIIALASTLGSLYFSEIAKMPPCTLCWYQRIFMYPIILILAINLWKKDDMARIYSLSLAIPGAIIAGYHYFIQTFQTPSFCSVADGGISCLVKSFEKFGYITIPMMAFTGFILIIILLAIYNKKN
jgi:disulfide bond formation protein DsbB